MRNLLSLQAPLAAAALLLSSGLAQADEIGSTVNVVNTVTASLDTNQRTLALNDPVSQDELIVTGTNAVSEFKFKDDTKVALGPGAQLKLDRFVYDPAKADGTIAVDLVKGAFRFITGVAKKPSYKIDTPNATIAVRGTIFDLFVQQDGTTWLLLHEGGVRVCSKRNPANCQDNDRPGHMMRVTSVGDIGSPICWSGLPGSNSVPFETAFPFVVQPPSIDDQPIYVRDDIVREDCAAPRGTPPVRRASYQPVDPPRYQRPLKKLTRVERVAPVEYTKPVRFKAKPVKEVNTPYIPPPVKIKNVPPVKIKVKPTRETKADDYNDTPKRKKAIKVVKVEVPEVKIKFKKPKRYQPRDDDDDNDYDKPKRKKYANTDGEVAKKILSFGLGVALGSIGNKRSNDYGDYPRHQRKQY